LRERDVRALQAYDWPGNVCELQNVIERAVILSTADRLHFDLVPTTASVSKAAPVENSSAEILTDVELRDLERSNPIAALERAEWKVSGPGGAAELLGVKPTTLNSRMKKLGIRRQR
jgi:transcriptional regulator with GAF, ATPase, and Fis domain